MINVYPDARLQSVFRLIRLQLKQRGRDPFELKINIDWRGARTMYRFVIAIKQIRPRRFTQSSFELINALPKCTWNQETCVLHTGNLKLLYHYFPFLFEKNFPFETMKKKKKKHRIIIIEDFIIKIK